MTTKRISIALLSIFVSVVAFAANKDLENDITMVSYEQSWLDSKATLALKNNSSEEVKNVLFLIMETRFGNFILCKAAQPSKAKSPISVIPS